MQTGFHVCDQVLLPRVNIVGCVKLAVQVVVLLRESLVGALQSAQLQTSVVLAFVECLSEPEILLVFSGKFTLKLRNFPLEFIFHLLKHGLSLEQFRIRTQNSLQSMLQVSLQFDVVRAQLVDLQLSCVDFFRGHDYVLLLRRCLALRDR